MADSPVEQVPVDDYTLPLGSIDTVQPGSDLTVVSYGTPLYTCRMSAIRMLSADNSTRDQSPPTAAAVPHTLFARQTPTP